MLNEVKSRFLSGKKMVKLILVLVGMIVSLNLYSQTLKFGHINSAELLSVMPEPKTADAALKKFSEQLEGQLKTMSAEYQGKVQDYQSKEALMADAIKQTKVKEITDLETRIQDFQQNGQESIQKKKEELYAPILKKAQDAITAVAKENGYTYVFDMSLGVVVYAQESNDIMPLVKKKLGLAASSTTPSTK